MMDNEPLLKFIKNNTSNIYVSNEAIDKIANAFEEKEIVKNDHLLKAGKVSGYYYLEDGFMRAYTYQTNGNEVIT